MQDARRATLSDAAPQAHRSGPSTALRLLCAAVMVGGYALDQATKALAAAHLTPGEPHRLLGPVLRLNLTRNPGAAFSTGTGHTVLFSLLAVVALAVTVWFAVRAGTRLWSVALGVLAAGIAGNLTDRILRAPQGFSGHVVDFLEIPHWPIFNVADICINVAALLILILAWRGVRLDGRPAADKAADKAAGEATDEATDEAGHE